MFYSKKKFMRIVASVLVFYFTLSPAPLQYTVNIPGVLDLQKAAFAQTKQEENEKIIEDAKDFLAEIKQVETPSFWQKHKWKIIVGGAVVVAAGWIIFSGGTATPAATAGVAGATAFGSHSVVYCLTVPTLVTATSATGVVSFANATTALTGVAAAVEISYLFSNDEEYDFVEYMKRNRLVMTKLVRRDILSAIDINHAHIVNSASKKEVLQKINSIVLSILKRNEASMPKY